MPAPKAAYSRDPAFRGINSSLERGLLQMTSQSIAGVLGAIVACLVLIAAVAYGPIGQFGKPAKAVQQPVAAPAAPLPRGPVIKEVPN
jgi:hypothetical protein